jgi:hypothetical protein
VPGDKLNVCVAVWCGESGTDAEGGIVEVQEASAQASTVTIVVFQVTIWSVTINSLVADCDVEDDLEVELELDELDEDVITIVEVEVETAMVLVLKKVW